FSLSRSSFDCAEDHSGSILDGTIPAVVKRNFSGREISFSNVNINGSGGNTLVVEPGAPVNIALNWNVVALPGIYCPGCVTQYYFGVNDLAITCLTGNNGSRSLNLTAPTEPGIYPIQSTYSFQYSCTNTASSLSEQLDGAIGVLIVGNPQKLIATDTSGNSASDSFNRTLLDTIPPKASLRDIRLPINEEGLASLTPEMIQISATEACGIEEVTLSSTDFTCAEVGENEVTLSVTDSSGNTGRATAIV